MTRRKLRVMIISMGGPRQEHMKEQFRALLDEFEEPVFVPGVPSRSLRNRWQFLCYAQEAGLLPQAEWEALSAAQHDDSLQLFDALKNVPIEPGRRGSPQDVSLHYSVELWRKAKTINRGRAVLGCTLAHLIAWRQFITGDFDVLLEDNVRVGPDMAERIRQAQAASASFGNKRGTTCHLRYVGWLGSRPNLEWMYSSYIPRCQYESTIVPFPTTQDIEKDLREANYGEPTRGDTPEQENELDKSAKHTKPGGSPVWGSYAYWISKQAYQEVLRVLRQDVGALLWKGKRMRYYSVKPIDKVLPRQIMSLFGQDAVHLSTHPTVFRAPMLTSKIHAKWDPEFCHSTSYQLGRVGLSWSDLRLTCQERQIVQFYKENGEWLTLAQLEERNEGPANNEGM